MQGRVLPANSLEARPVGTGFLEANDFDFVAGLYDTLLDCAGFHGSTNRPYIELMALKPLLSLGLAETQPRNWPKSAGL